MVSWQLPLQNHRAPRRPWMLRSIYSSVNGHVGGFYLLAVVNYAAMHIGLQIAVPIPAFSSFVCIKGYNFGVTENSGIFKIHCS